jgi:hypothetical protein
VIRWRGANPPTNKLLVKGTLLSVGFVIGQDNRYGIYEVRTREADGHAGTRYEVRDADMASDLDIRVGITPPVVFQASDPAECEAWVIGHSAQK